VLSLLPDAFDTDLSAPEEIILEPEAPQIESEALIPDDVSDDVEEEGKIYPPPIPPQVAEQVWGTYRTSGESKRSTPRQKMLEFEKLSPANKRRVWKMMNEKERDVIRSQVSKKLQGTYFSFLSRERD
jgi:hypothetical protein